MTYRVTVLGVGTTRRYETATEPTIEDGVMILADAYRHMDETEVNGEPGIWVVVPAGEVRVFGGIIEMTEYTGTPSVPPGAPE